MILVLAYGNPLRGDDGVGWRVAEALGDGRSVEVVYTHQLVPEAAARLAGVEGVLFIDAAVGEDAGRVSTRRVEPEAGRVDLGHVLTPAHLLQLTQLVFGRAPEARLVTVVGAEFGFAARLSRAAEAAIPEAVRQARAALQALAAQDDTRAVGAESS